MVEPEVGTRGKSREVEAMVFNAGKRREVMAVVGKGGLGWEVEAVGDTRSNLGKAQAVVDKPGKWGYPCTVVKAAFATRGTAVMERPWLIRRCQLQRPWQGRRPTAATACWKAGVTYIPKLNNAGDRS